MTPSLTHRPAAELKPHPLNKHRPRLWPGTPGWLGFVADIEGRGIQEPIAITAAGLILNGVTRWKAADVLGVDKVPTIPCRVVPDTQVLTTLVEELGLSKTLTKGQKAYLLWPIVADTVQEMRDRQLQALKAGKGRTIADSVGDGQATSSIEAFCESLGFSKDLLTQARTLHDLWAGEKAALARYPHVKRGDLKELRDEWEAKILSHESPIGLGAALAGMAGQATTADKPKRVNTEVQLDLFSDGVQALTKVAKSWDKISAKARPEFVEAWRRAAAEWPPDLRRELAESLIADLEQPV